MFSSLNSVNLRLISKLVFDRRKCMARLWLVNWDLFHVHWRMLLDRICACMLGYLGFWWCLRRTLGFFGFFLIRGVQNPSLGCFQCGSNEKLLRQVLCLCCRWCLLCFGGLAWLIGRLLHIVVYALLRVCPRCLLMVWLIIFMMLGLLGNAILRCFRCCIQLIFLSR